MRIIYISTYPPIECGIATYTQYLTDEMLNNKIEIHILSQSGAKGEHVHEVFNPNDVNIAFKLFHYVSRLTPDLIHIQHEFGLFGYERGVQIIDFLLRCKIAKIPVITTFHSVYEVPARKEKIITEEIFRLSTELIVHEDFQKKILQENYKCLKPIHVIPHGVRKIKINKDSKELLGLSSKKVVLLTGYFRTTKHFEKLIDIFPEVMEKVPNAVLLIASKLRITEFNEKREQLLKLFRHLGNKEHIRILKGQFPQYTLDNIMNAADIAVMPYSSGAQSGVLAQLSAINVPIVSSNLQSFKLWNEASGGGLSSNSNEDYINNIVKLLEKEGLAQEMRNNIKKFNKSRFWDVIAEKHLRIYENIVVKEDEISEFFYVPDPKLNH